MCLSFLMKNKYINKEQRSNYNKQHKTQEVLKNNKKKTKKIHDRNRKPQSMRVPPKTKIKNNTDIEPRRNSWARSQTNYNHH